MPQTEQAPSSLWFFEISLEPRAKIALLSFLPRICHGGGGGTVLSLAKETSPSSLSFALSSGQGLL